MFGSLRSSLNLWRFTQGALLLLLSLIQSACLIIELDITEVVSPGGIVTLRIAVQEDQDDANPWRGVEMVLVPDDWTLTAGTYTASDINGTVGSGSLVEDSDWADSAAVGVYPAPAGMKWIGLVSDAAYSHGDTLIMETEIEFAAGTATGTFPIGVVVTKEDYFPSQGDWFATGGSTIVGADSAMANYVTVAPVTLIRDLVEVPEPAIQALSAAGSGLTESLMDSLLTDHLDLATEFTIRGVVLTDPLKSGLAPWIAARPGPSRVYVYLRDPAADSLGNEAMGILMVDDSYETNGTLSLTPGRVIEATGHLAQFVNSIMFLPTGVVNLGHYTDLGLSDSIVAPDTVQTSDVNQAIGFESYQANWSNYNHIRGAYVCLDDVTAFRRTESVGRPDWAITSDGGATAVTTYDMSLRFRNDRDGVYQSPFDVLTTDFVPPAIGSNISVCGTVEHQPFNDPYALAAPANAMLSLVPWNDSDLTSDGQQALTVVAKVYAEGPFASGSMHRNAGFTDNLPNAQPYSDSFFDGTVLDHDPADQVSEVPDSVLDWVLVSLRSDVTSESEVPGSERTAFLMEDGSIVDTAAGLLTFPDVPLAGYYLVVRHRNHASIMSADTLDLSDGYGSWDFTTAMSQAYSVGGNPMKDLGDGNFGMFACDVNADGLVTAPDFNLWNAATTAGATGYEQADCNMDGIVTAPDFNLWNANTTAGASSQVPN